MTLSITDPMALVAIESGLVKAPLADEAAVGDQALDTPQKGASIGTPIPVVFCKRDETSASGGVLISPLASDARFVNDASNNVTAYYHLLLSEGQIGSIQVRDVFQGQIRTGTFTQTYNRRAGNWTPGNLITTPTNTSLKRPEASNYCGSLGTYEGISTLSFNSTYGNGIDSYKKQVHCFIRNGIQVPRLIEGTTGSSNNFADLVQWLLINSAKLPSSLIDTDALLEAAYFLLANRVLCDISIEQSENLSDFIAKTAPYFLLAETNNKGKRGLRPLLPLFVDNKPLTLPVAWEFTFTEEHIEPDGLEISYIPLVDRKPFCVQVLWRQQAATDDFGIIRTSEVRYSGQALTGPYEQHDMSAFCTNEAHAVKVGAYILARRKYVSHTARITCRPISGAEALVPGSIVKVNLARTSTSTGGKAHNYLYEINRITQLVTGEISYDLTHFPISSTGVSLVASDVAAAAGTGVILTTNRSGTVLDTNSSTDTSVPAEVFTPTGSTQSYEAVLYSNAGEGTPGDSSPGGFGSNANGVYTVNSADGKTGEGAAISVANPGCANPVTVFYVIDADGKMTVLSESQFIVAGSFLQGKYITASVQCPGDAQPRFLEPLYINNGNAWSPAGQTRPHVCYNYSIYSLNTQNQWGIFIDQFNSWDCPPAVLKVEKRIINASLQYIYSTLQSGPVFQQTGYYCNSPSEVPFLCKVIIHSITYQGTSLTLTSAQSPSPPVSTWITDPEFYLQRDPYIWLN